MHASKFVQFHVRRQSKLLPCRLCVASDCPNILAGFPWLPPCRLSVRLGCLNSLAIRCTSSPCRSCSSCIPRNVICNSAKPRLSVFVSLKMSKFAMNVEVGRCVFRSMCCQTGHVLRSREVYSAYKNNVRC